jgi:hypothetical protein
MGKSAKHHVDEGPSHQVVVAPVSAVPEKSPPTHAIVMPQRDTSGTTAAPRRVSDENTRKRKEPATGNSDVDVDTVPTDEDEILSILTKRIWSEATNDVEDALEELDDLFHDPVEDKPKQKNYACYGF